MNYPFNIDFDCNETTDCFGIWQTVVSQFRAPTIGEKRHKTPWGCTVISKTNGCDIFRGVIWLSGAWARCCHVENKRMGWKQSEERSWDGDRCLRHLFRPIKLCLSFAPPVRLPSPASIRDISCVVFSGEMWRVVSPPLRLSASLPLHLCCSSRANLHTLSCYLRKHLNDYL